MDLLTLMRILLHRWYLILPCVILTAAASWGAYASVAPDYESSGSLLLLNPPSQVDKATGRANPYVGNLVTAGSVVSVILNSPAYHREFKDRGVTGTYTVFADPSSPIIIVTSRDDTPEQAQASTEQVLEKFDEVLVARQSDLGVPNSIRVTTQVVTAPSVPTPINGSRLRAALAVFAVGIAFTLLGTFALEGIARSRRNARPPTADVAHRDQVVECPFCNTVMRGNQLSGHLSDVHGDEQDQRSPELYPLKKKRSPTQ